MGIRAMAVSLSTYKEPDFGVEPGTDFWAVENGYISITPIHHDLTHYGCLEQLTGRDWLGEV
jgi:broad specificity polyphosphatase/5'/3'-nucleotidase SurE